MLKLFRILEDHQALKDEFEQFKAHYDEAHSVSPTVNPSTMREQLIDRMARLSSDDSVIVALRALIRVNKEIARATANSPETAGTPEGTHASGGVYYLEKIDRDLSSLWALAQGMRTKAAEGLPSKLGRSQGADASPVKRSY
ncbi:MAG: hypothetical protein AAFX93_19875 [Verrucomicrobiota bacterium]